MRKYMQFIKSIAITALLFTGFTAGTIAQDTTTNVNPDKKAPVVLSTTPTNGEQNVDLSSVFEITFSSEMDETTINGTTIQLYAASSDSMHDMHDEMMQRDQNRDQINNRTAINDSENRWQYSKDTVSGTISYSDKVAVFTPDEDLKEGTQYTLTVTNGVMSSENVSLENEQNWSFTTTGSSDSAYSDNQFDNQYDRSDMETTSDMERTETRSENQDENRSLYATSTEASQDEKKMIDLGKAGQFVILAKANINNETESRITGHVGEGSVADGTKKEQKDRTEKKDSETAQQTTTDQDVEWQTNRRETSIPDVTEAIEDMMSAYNITSMQNGDDLARGEATRDQATRDQATRDEDVTVHEDGLFHSNDLSPGVHEWKESLNIDSDVNLSGSEDDVWLIKVGNNLTVDEDIVFTLSDGAQADNVYWYVEGEVTLGKNAEFEGIILSMNDITLEKGAKLNGRMFSQSSITLDDNTITEPRRLSGQTTSTNR